MSNCEKCHKPSGTLVVKCELGFHSMYDNQFKKDLPYDPKFLCMDCWKQILRG